MGSRYPLPIVSMSASPPARQRAVTKQTTLAHCIARWGTRRVLCASGESFISRSIDLSTGWYVPQTAAACGLTDCGARAAGMKNFWTSVKACACSRPHVPSKKIDKIGSSGSESKMSNFSTH